MTMTQSSPGPASATGTVPPGVILAGGLARRMGGGDKGLRLLGGRPMLAHVIDRLAPQCAPLALNANGDPARFAAFGLPVLPDPLPDHPGPLAGVLAGMLWARGLGAGHVLTAAADTPFFPADLAARLVAAAGAGLALAATGTEGRPVPQPTFGLWPVALVGALRAALEGGERRLGVWAAGQGAVLVGFGTGAEDPFFNVNTPAELDQAERRIGGGA